MGLVFLELRIIKCWKWELFGWVHWPFILTCKQNQHDRKTNQVWNGLQSFCVDLFFESFSMKTITIPNATQQSQLPTETQNAASDLGQGLKWKKVELWATCSFFPDLVDTLFFFSHHLIRMAFLIVYCNDLIASSVQTFGFTCSWWLPRMLTPGWGLQGRRDLFRAVGSRLQRGKLLVVGFHFKGRLQESFKHVVILVENPFYYSTEST